MLAKFYYYNYIIIVNDYLNFHKSSTSIYTSVYIDFYASVLFPF